MNSVLQTKPIIELTDANVDEIINGSSLPIAIYFSAPWCAACKSFMPYLEEISTELSKKLNIYKMDIDEHPDTANKYSVRSLPTVIVFKNAEIQDVKVGVSTKAEFIKWLKKAL
jgi:thioredoxin 1